MLIPIMCSMVSKKELLTDVEIGPRDQYPGGKPCLQ